MILTRDNILRYIKEKKAVTPTMIAEDFETSTMIASAALSELAKDNLIKITYLKLASSPYYYDPKQASILIEIGNKHLKGYDKEFFLKLKEQEVINAASLSIQEGLAVERLKDFAKSLEIDYNGKTLKFWVWYQRNLDETKKQILEVLSPSSNSTSSKSTSKSSNNNSEIKKTSSKKLKLDSSNIVNSTVDKNLKESKIIKNSEFKSSKNTNFFDDMEKDYSKKNKNSNSSNEENLNQNNLNQYESNKVENSSSNSINISNKFIPKETFENKVENFIENYFRENYLVMESKEKTEKGIRYDVKLVANTIEIIFDCYYFNKKPTDIDIIKFYSSSIRPKIIFIENVPKKLLKLAENLENLTIINI